MIESSFSMVLRVFSDMPSGPSLASALFHQLAQVARGRLAARHELARIFVFQLFETEGAAARDRHGLSEQLRRIEARKPRLASAGGAHRSG